MFEIFTDNALINKPENQQKADNALRWTESLFTPKELKELIKTRIEVINKVKDPKEFKFLCKKIRERLFK